MCKVIAVSNQKGGTAKTASAVNIGVGLARRGKKVLLIDNDSQGDLTKSLWRDNGGNAIEPDTIEYTLANILSNCINDEEIDLDKGIIHHREGVDLIPGNVDLSGLEMTLVSVTFRETMLKTYIDQMRERYDFIIIDCAPSLSMLTINALFAADSVLIPVVAEYLPVRGLEQLLKTIRNVKKHYNEKLTVEGILLTMMIKRTNLSRDIRDLLYEYYGDSIYIFKEDIPRSVRTAEASALGMSIYEYAADNKVAQAYEKVTEEVLSHGN